MISNLNAIVLQRPVQTYAGHIDATYNGKVEYVVLTTLTPRQFYDQVIWPIFTEYTQCTLEQLPISDLAEIISDLGHTVLPVNPDAPPDCRSVYALYHSDYEEGKVYPDSWDTQT